MRDEDKPDRKERPVTMLQSITLRNFKLFDERGVTIEPSKITVLVGANGTGKSSILQSLQLLKQNADQGVIGSLQFNGKEINLGSFKDVVHNQDTTRTMEIELRIPYSGFGDLDKLTPAVAANGTYIYQVQQSGNRLFNHSCEVRRDDSVYIRANTTPVPFVDPPEFLLPVASRTDTSFEVPNGYGTDTVTILGTPDVSPKITLQVIANIGRPINPSYHNVDQLDAAMVAIEDAFNMLSSCIQRFLGTARFTPAIRGFDQLTYEIGNSQAAASGGNDGVRRSQAIANLVAESPEIAEEVSQKLNHVLRQRDRVLRHRLADSRLFPEMSRGRQSINVVNEAFGLNQLIAPMFDLVMAEPGALVAIEEPEIHLHPRAQAALADMFIEFALQEDKQVVMTTHSEHILMSLLGAIAAGRMQPADLAVYELYREGWSARVKRLEVNAHGQIDGGLREFMEVDIDKVGELVASRFR